MIEKVLEVGDRNGGRGGGPLVVDRLEQIAGDAAECGMQVGQEMKPLQAVALFGEPSNLWAVRVSGKETSKSATAYTIFHFLKLLAVGGGDA